MRQIARAAHPGARRDELSTPALLVDLDAFEANVARAAEIVAGTGKSIRPHVKTHRTPALALRQLVGYVTGVTCATVGEAEAMADAGVRDILVANEVVSPEKTARLVALAQRARVSVAVDSHEGIDALARPAKGQSQTIYVLVDVDVGLGRCGVSDPASALELARSVDHVAGLELVGIMGYEGRVRARDEDRISRIRRAYDSLAEVKARLDREGFRVEVVSSAGTATIREAALDPVITEIQAGTYALMEPDLEGLDLGFRPATELIGTVVSRRADRVIVDVGKKAVACDYGLPRALADGVETMSTHDEHSTLRWPTDPPPIGGKVRLRPQNIRHTFNLYDVVHLMRGDELVEVAPVSARGCSW